MTAITLTVISVLALRQVRQGGDATAVHVTSSTTQSRVTEGVMPMGGLVGQHRESLRAAAAQAEARTTTRGGLAERYAEQRAAARAAVRTASIMR
jgi:hypothetical protein